MLGHSNFSYQNSAQICSLLKNYMLSSSNLLDIIITIILYAINLLISQSTVEIRPDAYSNDFSPDYLRGNRI
jgi:hypothetical protein